VQRAKQLTIVEFEVISSWQTQLKDLGFLSRRRGRIWFPFGIQILLLILFNGTQLEELHQATGSMIWGSLLG